MSLQTAAPAELNNVLDPSDAFPRRHIGPRPAEIDAMLERIGRASLDDLAGAAVPASIRMDGPLDLPAALAERELVESLRVIAGRNRVMRSCIGMGYHGTITPPVILRNILENPGWYTQYTPYQAEIAQGRLEALLNFQTMVADLTALPLAGASLLDEGTAAAEAMAMCHAAARGKRNGFFVAEDCHPQTIGVLRTRAQGLGIELLVGPAGAIDTEAGTGGLCGALVQYPATDGVIADFAALAERLHDAGALLCVAADPLALTLLRPPGEFGADIAVGSTQRFGVPMGFGGPHAAYLATRESLARRIPGRIIGVSRDARGDPAYRMAIQTREQHIRREKATSNICTAQALLAIIAGMYAVYHGPDGLRHVARRVHAHTIALAKGLETIGHETLGEGPLFDTIRVCLGNDRTADDVHRAAVERGINLRRYDDGTVGVTLDQTSDATLVEDLLDVFGATEHLPIDDLLVAAQAAGLDRLGSFERTSPFLEHPVFNSHHSETEMLRYIFRLQERDLSLAHSMIPLGSCTMKLNATSEMLPVTWPGFADLHPFAPRDQWEGYAELFADLERWLAEITRLPAVSLQPNAGAQGEYAGLMVIRGYHRRNHEIGRDAEPRDVCLIPTSAHGTNPASAIMAGMRVVPIACDDAGNIDLDDLRAKVDEHAPRLAALMITYPSTHGVFEDTVRAACDAVHAAGGQVYLDGANMNAQVGLTAPGLIGADVCHLNLHKTFCIPHGGGGPGMGPITVAAHLAPFLPGHPVSAPASAGEHAIGPISAAPYGSPSILTISWAYIAMMGPAGLTRATQVAILSANYMAARLRGHYDILYAAPDGTVAHEFIIDCRPFEQSAGIRIDDIAKRLVDYGFHAPTMAWPVPGTLMIEPTESEPKAELDRFCDALIAIREEIRAIERGEVDREDNPLRNAPHTAKMVAADEWDHPYGREQAAFPVPWVRDRKFWPAVARVDNAYGDRHLFCTCPSVAELA